jgi:hypothetical protein
MCQVVSTKGLCGWQLRFLKCSGASDCWRSGHLSINRKLKQIGYIVLTMNAIIEVIKKKCQCYADNESNKQEQKQGELFACT